jgi:gliding motility-associated lipoprotein GldD
MKRIWLLYFVLLVVLVSCNSTYTQKKKGFFKIDFPEKQYQVFDKEGYPYSFEYPVYATVVKDTTFFEEKAENPWWINIDIPRFGGRIYISYKEVDKNNFDSLVNDGYKMAYKQHTEVATQIRDSNMITPNGVEGVYFILKGNTATANQFFLSDSTSHFLRGALYFDAAPNEDSLSIVNDFLREDLKHLISTLKWKTPGPSSTALRTTVSGPAKIAEIEKAEHK